MNNDRPEITKVEDGFTFTSAERERLDAPVKKMLPFHVLPLERTTRVNGYKTLPNGDSNPNFGKEEDVFIFKAELDSTDAKGQWYSAWVSSAISERSKLGKISEALFGSYDGIKGVQAADLVGLPFQCALKDVVTKAGEKRQVLDLDKIMPAADDQVVVKADVVLDDLPSDEDGAAMLDAALNSIN